MKKIVVFALSLSFVSPAQAFGCPTCATEWTQILNNVQLMQSYSEQARQTVQQVRMLEDQIKNTQNLTGGDWGDLVQSLTKVNQIAATGEALAFSASNLSDKTSALFKAAGYSGNESIDNYSSQYRALSQSLGDTALGALGVANQVYNDQARAQRTIDTIQSASSSATGRLQAIQAGNQLTAQVIQALQKLESLNQAQIQTTSTAMAVEAERQQMEQKFLEEFVGNNDNKTSPSTINILPTFTF